MIALTRAVSPTLPQCQLAHRDREPIDLPRACSQHQRYEALLEELGARVVRVPPAPDLPDAVFIEDTAVVVDEVAVMARPGAPSRRAEVRPVAEVLSRYRPVRGIEAPGTLDGGDVLRLGRDVWVGGSARTNRTGVDQLKAILQPLGYRVRRVPVEGCLHLKTAVTAASPDLLVLNPSWVDPGALGGSREIVAVEPREPWAANVLRVGEVVVVPASHPRTAERLIARGLEVRTVDVSELARAEAGLTCGSVLLDG